MKDPTEMIDEILFDMIAVGTFAVFVWGALTAKSLAVQTLYGATIGLAIWPNLRRHS